MVAPPVIVRVPNVCLTIAAKIGFPKQRLPPLSHMLVARGGAWAGGIASWTGILSLARISDAPHCAAFGARWVRSYILSPWNHNDFFAYLLKPPLEFGTEWLDEIIGPVRAL